MRPIDKAKVAVVTAACLIGLTIVLKNVLNIPADILSRYYYLYHYFFRVYCCPELRREGVKRDKAAKYVL